jgi:hypothetical protein
LGQLGQSAVPTALTAELAKIGLSGAGAANTVPLFALTLGTGTKAIVAAIAIILLLVGSILLNAPFKHPVPPTLNPGPVTSSAAPDDGLELPEDLRTLLAENGRNNARLLSGTRAVIDTYRMSVRGAAGQVKIEEYARQSIWSGGDRIRVETVNDRARSTPAGAFTERLNGGMMTYAVPQDERIIITPEEVYRFPERGLEQVAGRGPEETFAQSSALHRFLYVCDMPLDEWVFAKWNQNRQRPTLTSEILEGTAVRVLTWHFPATANNVDVVSKIYVVPAQGSAITRSVAYYEGKLIQEISARIGGSAERGFYFESAVEKDYGNDGALVGEFSAKMVTLSREPNSDASRFTLEGLRIPAGTGIREQVQSSNTAAHPPAGDSP